MTILDIIDKKKNKEELNNQEIEFFIKGYTEGTITDYQAAALIMAIYLNGMTKEETTNLTLAMAKSGDILDLSELNEIIVDKHSTGGVGDKVSIVLLPLVAACDVPVAKMSGRGLGFTGGTADKLESIPGYNTKLDMDKFIENIKKIGISMITQTADLAPADKKIYALRDSISCVESIPLIASSIMSKKIASGADKIVLDVTVGSGAFMQNLDEATKLASTMIEIGKLAKKETVSIITNMDEPLGYAVGNTLEIKEAVNALKGDMPKDLREVVLELGSYMLKLENRTETLEEAKQLLVEKLENGEAYNKFIELVRNQGGDTSYIEDLEKFNKAKYIEEIYSPKEGYIYEINAKSIGKLACYLGAGRIKKEDDIDLDVGIILNKKVGDYVKEGEALAYIHSNDNIKLKESKEKILNIIKINDKKVEPNETIIKVLS